MVNLLIPYHVPRNSKGKAKTDEQVHHLALLALIEVVVGIIVIPIITISVPPSPTAASSTVIALACHE